MPASLTKNFVSSFLVIVVFFSLQIFAKSGIEIPISRLSPEEVINLAEKALEQED
jgi:hypothetical protein